MKKIEEDKKIEEVLHPYKVKRILVRILGFDIQVPLFILMRALGVESDKEILSYIIYSTDEVSLQKELMDMLRDSVKDSESILVDVEQLSISPSTPLFVCTHSKLK